MVGTYDPNTYIVLDGTLYMYGANDEYIGYLRRGSHISNVCVNNFEYKRLSNIFTTKFCIIGVLSQDGLLQMSEAYPEWFTYFAELNRVMMKTQGSYLESLLISKGLENIAEN